MSAPLPTAGDNTREDQQQQQRRRSLLRSPILPFTPSLERIQRRTSRLHSWVSSHSFNETSPEISSDSSIDAPTKLPETAEAESTRRSSTTESRQQHAVAVAPDNARNSILELRSGQQYRRRIESDPLPGSPIKQVSCKLALGSIRKSSHSSFQHKNLTNTHNNPDTNTAHSKTIRENSPIAIRTVHASAITSPSTVNIPNPQTSATDLGHHPSPKQDTSTHHNPNNQPPLELRENPLEMDLVKVNQLVYNNVPLLYGDDPNELRTFFKCCEHVRGCLTEEEKGMFLRLVPTRLRGRAADLVDGSEIRSYEGFQTILREKLTPSRPYLLCVNDLRQCCQLPGETLASFGRRVEKSLHECEQKADSRHAGAATAVKRDLQELAIHVFRTGITNVHHRIFLSQGSEETLPDLVKSAEKLEEAERYTPLYSPQALQYPYTTQPEPLGRDNRVNTQQHGPTQVTRMDRTGYPGAGATEWQGSLLPGPGIQGLPQAHTPNHEGRYSHFTAPTTPYMQPAHFNDPVVDFVHNRIDYNSANTHARPPNSPRLAVPIKQEQPPPRRPLPKCGFCSKTGHTYADCRMRKNTPYCSQCRAYGHNNQACPKLATNTSRKPHISLLQDQSRRPVEPRQRRRCDFCDRWGHCIDECRTKQKWETRGAQSSYQSEN